MRQHPDPAVGAGPPTEATTMDKLTLSIAFSDNERTRPIA